MKPAPPGAGEGADTAMAAAERPSRVGRAGPRVGRQFGWVSGGRVAGALVQVVTLGLVARWSGPSGFGVVGLVLSGVVIVQTASDLGLPTFVARERASNPSSPSIARALQLNNRTAAVMAGALLAILGACGGWIDGQFLLLMPLAVWAAVDRNTDAWLGVALADGDAWMNSLSLLARRVGGLLLMIVLVGLGVSALLAFSTALAVVGVAVNAVAHRRITARIAGTATREVATRSILRAAVPFWINSTATQLRNLDVLIVGAVAGGAQTAFYTVASKVTGPMRILPGSLASVLIPAAARAGTARLAQARRPVVIVLGSMAVLYATSAIAAPWVVPLALGSDFHGAVVPVQIVCGGLLFAACASVLGSLLQGGGHGVLVARLAVGYSLMCLTTVAVGSAWFGAVGAAVALSTSFFLQATALAIALRRVQSPEAHPAGEPAMDPSPRMKADSA